MEYFDDIEWIEEKYGQRFCNSGGAAGADTVFEEECTKKGIPVIAWSFAGHNTKSPNKKVLSKEELKEGLEHIEIANKSLKRNIYNLSPYVKNLLARNWFQVKNSKTIYAVGTLEDDMKKVRGGTGWAVQCGIDNKKPIYVFDQDKNIWFQWIGERYQFIQIDFVPKLLDRFAGIGTREINENGINAIKKLLNQ